MYLPLSAMQLRGMEKACRNHSTVSAVLTGCVTRPHMDKYRQVHNLRKTATTGKTATTERKTKPQENLSPQECPQVNVTVNRMPLR